MDWLQRPSACWIKSDSGSMHLLRESGQGGKAGVGIQLCPASPTRQALTNMQHFNEASPCKCNILAQSDNSI